MNRGRLVSRLCAVIVAPVLALGVMAMAPMDAAHAAPPVPTGLVATGGPIPTLSWTRVPGATRYVVQGAETSSFSAPVFNTETVNTSYVPTRMLKDGILYWRVQAKDDSGSSDFASTQTTIATYPAPTGITISGPTGGAVLPPISPPVIHWDSVAGATSYDVEVDAEGDGVGGSVREGVLTTTYVWPEPQGVGERVGNEDFFVRVRARFENNLQTNWSPYVTYDVTQLPEVTSATCAAEAVCAPGARARGPRPSKTVQDVVFDWDPVKGAKYYEIWVALDRDFNNQVERRNVYRHSLLAGHRPTTTTTTSGRSGRSTRPTSPRPGRPSRASSSVAGRTRRRRSGPPVTSSPAAVGDDFYYQWSPVRTRRATRSTSGTTRTSPPTPTNLLAPPRRPRTRPGTGSTRACHPRAS